MKSTRVELMNTWPARVLLGLALALLVRAFEHLVGLRAFDPAEFLTLPVLVVVMITAFALITDPVQPAGGRTYAPAADGPSAPAATRMHSRLSPWLAGLLVLILLAGVRAVLHYVGVVEFRSSDFLSLPIIVCIAVLAAMIWSWRMR